MTEPQNTDAQVKFLLSDFNARLKDIDQRNKLIRERVLLLGKNLITSRQENEDGLKELKQENIQIKTDIEKLKRISNALLTEFNKFVKKEELTLLERMLKDFQPIEFMRRSDVEKLINDKININSIKPKQ